MSDERHKNLTLKLYGGQARYELFNRSREVIKLFDLNSLYYSKSSEQRLKIDLANLDKLKQLIRDNVASPDMLQFLSLQMFTPCYTLITHFNHFMKYLSYFNTSIFKQVKQMQVLGGIFDEEFNLNQPGFKVIKNNNKYVIQQHEQSYFYSPSTNIFIDYAILPIKFNSTYRLFLIQLRDFKKQLLKNVRTQYLGQTIGVEYRLIGYNINGYQLSQNVQITQKQLCQLQANYNFDEFQLSLLQLNKSFCISYQYTTMRKQFKTIDKSKQERPIIEYQAVHSRLIDSLTTVCTFTALMNKIIVTPSLLVPFKDYFQWIHNEILERLISLRECCGGYGYLKYSGHPQLIQRVAYRASLNKRTGQLPTNKEFLQQVLYPTSDPELKPQLLQPSKFPEISHNTLIKQYYVICLNRRLAVNMSSQRQVKQYLPHFVKDVGMHQFNASQRQIIYRQDRSPLLNLMRYTVINYLMDGEQYLDYAPITLARIQYKNMLIKQRSLLLQELLPQLEYFYNGFEMRDFTDIIHGQSDVEAFYEKVLATSAKNNRNSPEYLSYVRQPVIRLLNAKL